MGTGTPVYAARSGNLVTVGGGCGYGVEVTDSSGVSYLYCHFNSRVRTGGSVSTGELIGYSGSTGNSTGPHLHMEITAGGVGRCPQNFLLALYDGRTPPSPSSLPTSGCSY